MTGGKLSSGGRKWANLGDLKRGLRRKHRG